MNHLSAKPPDMRLVGIGLYPVIAGVGISTRAIADAVIAEGGIEPVARLFEISNRLVRDALQFEERLAA